MTGQAFGDLPDDLPPGFCAYQEPWDKTPCGASAVVHGISGDNAAEGCDKHRDLLEHHSQWVHPWTAACANGLFVEAENRCTTDRGRR